MTDYCQGCCDYFGLGCDYRTMNYGECPCINCVVKMMCTQICEEHQKWRNTLVDSIKA